MNREMPAPDGKTTPPEQPRKRGLLLRFLYRVYTNYLGVTPPAPEQERTAAAVLIGGIILGLVGIVVLVFFLWMTTAKLGGTR